MIIKLVCSIKKAEKILGWKPYYSNIEKIIKDEIWWYNYLKKKRYPRKYILMKKKLKLLAI